MVQLLPNPLATPFDASGPPVRARRVQSRALDLQVCEIPSPAHTGPHRTYAPLQDVAPAQPRASPLSSGLPARASQDCRALLPLVPLAVRGGVLLGKPPLPLPAPR